MSQNTADLTLTFSLAHKQIVGLSQTAKVQVTDNSAFTQRVASLQSCLPVPAFNEKEQREQRTASTEPRATPGVNNKNKSYAVAVKHTATNSALNDKCFIKVTNQKKKVSAPLDVPRLLQDQPTGDHQDQ